jgi:hypothetical protein
VLTLRCHFFHMHLDKPNPEIIDRQELLKMWNELIVTICCFLLVVGAPYSLTLFILGQYPLAMLTILFDVLLSVIVIKVMQADKERPVDRRRKY